MNIGDTAMNILVVDANGSRISRTRLPSLVPRPHLSWGVWSGHETTD